MLIIYNAGFCISEFGLLSFPLRSLDEGLYASVLAPVPLIFPH